MTLYIFQVNKVDQSKLTEEFGSIFADPVIATKVVARLQVHNGLYVCLLLLPLKHSVLVD